MRANKHPEAIRVTEALSGESTQEVGGDATNKAGPEDSQPAAEAKREDDSMADEGEGCQPSTPPPLLALGDHMREFLSGLLMLSLKQMTAGNGLGTPVAALAGTPRDQLKEVTLRTAPQDARFPTTNQVTLLHCCRTAHVLLDGQGLCTARALSLCQAVVPRSSSSNCRPVPLV